MTQTPFFDLIEIGMTIELGSHTFERDEIIRFAEKFDPQRFHLTEEGAADSHFGALCASGWHTLSMWMRKNVDNGRDAFIEAISQDGAAPVYGPSPGVCNIKWLHPVYVGDTITYRSTIINKRKNPKRPGWGMLMNHSDGVNQNGVKVMSMDGAVTIRTD